ncbi:DNA-directed RNA polymerase subunit D [Natrinema pellirubrum DSM 15624]|uniref:DNA-directed RNA polymerase subunit Rpo3 n=2 Tax=Natrinema TaxID=88723 RepID=A0AAF0PA97_9EURY|nr:MULTISPECIES: DNA-directed RNA polymerase subunit D [Natrinema]ELZ09779.1 DNA-directed RNA polymerase subunit D [Natrinema thermotolerans DSM 11552]AGB31569.1 DNA-directed RNA polymerase, alpha subunit/40 kD subunit [Natrinema pellirubrum DSM 15624]ELY73359.1 DNA-directed RNA polymerase subunit D [Natrinema pellirubrum DSM 15624]QCC60396.1 DNA-directed RNA polymerase subunit D [Natrinema thermotolerans]QCC61303.1 DNA-directed RNA polymerase subunit D [Natrinema thermotolerans]
MTAEYDVEFVEREDREARFLVRGVTPGFANGIRRAMIADVPTMAIDTVRFVENSSVMFDEQLALRMGLVPLTTPPVGEFAEDDTVTLSIDVEGPDTAYSGDLVSEDDLVQPADENVPIIDLKDGQRLEAEADAVIDRGKDHAKHQGGVAVGYRHLQRVEVEGDLPEFEDEERRIIRGVIEDDGELVPTSEFDHDLSNRYPGKEVRVEDVPEAFVFHVETDGSFSIEELVTRAADTLEARATELEDAVQL